MGQGGDVLEAAISERGAVVPLGGGQPAQDAAEAMVVVVLGEARQSKLGVGYAAEAFAIQNLGLKDGPEGLDLAVGPRRADLCAQVPDVQVSQPLSEQRQHARHPDHERQSVVAHQLQWLTAELEAFIQPFQDGRRPGLGQDAKANYEARMVIDQSNDPGLHVATAEVNEERSPDVDVDPAWDGSPQSPGSTRLFHQAIDSSGLISRPPTVERAPRYALATGNC